MIQNKGDIMDERNYKICRLQEIERKLKCNTVLKTRIEYCDLQEQLYGFTPSEAYELMQEAIRNNRKK